MHTHTYIHKYNVKNYNRNYYKLDTTYNNKVIKHQTDINLGLPASKLRFIVAFTSLKFQVALSIIS